MELCMGAVAAVGLGLLIGIISNQREVARNRRIDRMTEYLDKRLDLHSKRVDNVYQLIAVISEQLAKRSNYEEKSDERKQ